MFGVILIIFGIAGILGFAMLCADWLCNEFNWMPLVLIITSILIILGFNYYIDSLGDEKEWKTINTTNIITLKDTNKFYLRSFRNSYSEICYYYMTETSLGAEMRNIPMTGSFIEETDKMQPCIIIQKEHYVSKKYSWWKMFPDLQTRYLIKVPLNSIDKEYKIDMNN